MLLVRFVAGGRAYEFPAQASLSDNFGDLVQRTQRLPGLSGGWRHYGSSPSPAEIGNVRASFWLKAERPDELQAMLDALYVTRTYGLGRLYIRPLGAAGVRWVDCEVSSIQTPMNVRQRPDLLRQVQVTFQAPDPFWNEIGTEQWRWGDGTRWGDGGAVWGGSAVERGVGALLTTFSEVVPGAASAYPRLVLRFPAGASGSGVKIQRLVGTTVVDEVGWAGALVAGDVLEIDAGRLRVRLNGVSAYGASFTWISASWMRLVPGDNAMRVIFGSVTGAPTLTVRYNTRW